MLGKLFNKKRILEKAQKFSNLYADEDFIEWKRLSFDKRLELLVQQILSTDPESKEHYRACIKYQELKYGYDEIFKGWEIAEKQIREELRKAQELEKQIEK